MPKNIKNITLEESNHTGKQGKFLKLVKINFNFPCTWTTLDVDDLKQILRLWIEGEEELYPREQGFKGRFMLLEEICKVFAEKLPVGAYNVNVEVQKDGVD